MTEAAESPFREEPLKNRPPAPWWPTGSLRSEGHLERKPGETPYILMVEWENPGTGERCWIANEETKPPKESE